eukprot:3303304-Rhodomonas_salina.2
MCRHQIPLLCTSLTHLRINGLQAQPDSFVRFCSNLPRCAELADLDLQSCGISDGQVLSLAQCLAPSTALTALNVAKNAITNFFDFQFHLQKRISLQSLDFSGISDRFRVSDLGWLLLELTGVRKLVLRSLKLRADDGAQLARILELCKDLVHLDVGANLLGDGGLTALVQGLQQNVRLEYLDVSENAMSREKACELYAVVRGFNSIVSAFFGSFSPSAHADHTVDCYAIKCVGERSARRAGGDPGQWQNSLAVLHFQGNIGQNEMQKLAITLPRQTLLHLDLTGNNIGDSGAALLGAALRSCPNLACLLLDRNCIEKKGIEALAADLSTCAASLRTLSLAGNELGASGVRALATMLPQCTRLRSLNLHRTQLGAEGAEVLAKSNVEQVAAACVEAGQRRSLMLTKTRC